MILIFSESQDVSAREVCHWLTRYAVPVIWITEQTVLDVLNLRPTGSSLIAVDGKPIRLNEIQAVWFRRTIFRLQNLALKAPDGHFQAGLRHHLDEEIKSIGDFVQRKLLATVPVVLGKKKHAQINKLEILHLAVKHGLKVPPTLLTTQKQALLDFYELHAPLITKSTHHSIMTTEGDATLMAYTESLKAEDLSTLPPTFFPSLFQKQIEKWIEVRSFYVDSQFYSMAIFSQADAQTAIDFRKYNEEKPNRVVPFQLPDDITQKLHRLMVELDMDTGSIDLLVTPSRTYYFLEVNPEGQFGMVSYPCNYYLEEKIAQYLVQKSVRSHQHNPILA